MTVGERIKQKRIELGLSQEELAKRCGYKSRSSINKIELARDLPLNKAEKMAFILGCTPGYLMGWEDELTEENANFSVDMLGDPRFVTYAKKFFYSDYSKKEQIYNYIDFLLREQSPD